MKFISCLIQFYKEDDGQDLIEYSLLLAFVALALAGLVGGTGAGTNRVWSSMNSALLTAKSSIL